MLALTIAIAALGLAGYAVYELRKLIATMTEVADDEEDTQELWLGEGEFYAPDKAKLEAKFPDALGFSQSEGVPSAVTPTGVWSLHKLLTDKPDAARVRAIKP